MFCPSCGIEDKQTTQFCRACGTDLRPARQVFGMPDHITASAGTAREEIGRAFAVKIREAKTGKDLKVIAENVLPEIEKFLESPAEKRLRRMRVGTLIALIGFGAAVAFTFAAGALKEDDFIKVAALGFVTFCIGISFVINGYFLSIPKGEVSDKSGDADAQRKLDGYVAPAESSVNLAGTTNELALPEARQVFTSVTEETTRHLKEKEKVPRN